MATFSTNSTSGRDVLPTNYSSDQGHGSYPESSVTDNMLHLNYISSGPFSDIFAGYAQPLENGIELPVLTSMMSHDSSAKDPDLAASNLCEHSYNAWRDGRNEMSFMQMIAGSQNGAGDIIHSSVDDAHMSGRTHLGILNGQNLSSQQSRLSTLQGQGLSLSLKTQIPLPPFQHRPASSDTLILSSYQTVSGTGGSSKDDNSRSRFFQSNASPCGLSSITSVVPNSKYLKVAQQLLDEVVSVRNALKQKAARSQFVNNSAGTTDCKDNDGVKSDGMSSDPQESNVHSSGELSATEKQDLQNKMAKLLAMLDEVDRRYKQYYHQMQIVVSSFDVVAGCGAAKPYTALALQTISRQFHCLRDAINGQIRSTRKNLGEQDNSSSKGGGISRLRYIDQPLRQQRAIQQLGMIPQKAWRPQRGLPETSVSILRAWLFEHFLHPYPNDSEKSMLARQTGLTRGQVSNWFINARVRLWKPMIEEMYKEETGDTEMDSNSSSDNVPKGKDESRSSEEREDLKSPTRRCSTSQLNESSKSNAASMDMGTTAASFRSEANADDTFIKNLMLKDARPNIADCGLLHDALAQSGGSGQFMAYKMAELERYRNNGMSLTLGLQQCDGGLPVSDGPHGFLPARGEEKHRMAPPLEADAAGYDCINLMDQRDRIGPTHLLHNFVT